MGKWEGFVTNGSFEVGHMGEIRRIFGESFIGKVSNDANLTQDSTFSACAPQPRRKLH
jgi:hypothetical protein